MKRGQNKQGFTIVELLIVIVVIGILAAITLVAYNNVQSRSRDTVRRQDIKTIVKGLEMFYTDKGYYPSNSTYTPGSTVINGSWSTSADASWSNLAAVLAPYINKLPKPPGASSALGGLDGGNNYDYFGFTGGYCNVAAGQGYLLTYHTEAAQTNTLEGTCNGTQLGPYGPASNYRVVKN